jgi:D-serine deaminase-like pyridoxal phosphate-dependent protein
MNVFDLPTPCLLVDRGRLLLNAERMRAVGRRGGVALRPHVKTHKSPEIARLQHGGRPGPVTVSTLAEAEAFAGEGFEDITYAVPIEPGKFPRALALARRISLNLVTDSAETSEALAEAGAAAGLRPRVLLEIDCGDHRCGLDPEDPATADLARSLARNPSLEFAGLLTHGGQAYGATTEEGVRAAAREEREVPVRFAERLRGEGIAVPAVSIGSTPTMTHAQSLGGVTEIRPGSYIFFDAFMIVHGSCEPEDCALTVLAAIIHRSPHRMVLDAGAIALSKDEGPRDIDPGAGYGRLLRLDGTDTGLRVSRLSQEHGEIDLPEGFDGFPVGTRVRVLPNHSCLTAAQHDRYHVLEGGEVVDEWRIFRGW